MTSDLRVADLIIRRAEPADAAAVAAVYLRAFDAAMPTVRRAHTDDEVRDWVSHVLVPAGHVLVADRGTGVIAMMALSPGWIDQLYVDPGSQRSGVGTRLVDRAKTQHRSGLQLWTFQVNRPAQQFYERHGFVLRERTDGAANEECEPDLRYSWSGASQ